jgi:hypothetical protein
VSEDSLVLALRALIGKMWGHKAIETGHYEIEIQCLAEAIRQAARDEPPRLHVHSEEETF